MGSKHTHKVCKTCNVGMEDVDLYSGQGGMFCLEHYVDRVGHYPWVHERMGGSDYWRDVAEFHRQSMYGDFGD